MTVLNNARNADPSDIRAVGVSQLELINRYHRNVLQQAQQSFLWAIVAAGIGLGFYVAAVSFLLLKQPVNISDASLISGTLVEVIAGINFFLYGKASSQLASFHVYLDRTHRFLLANSACENIMADTQKDTTRAEIIQTIMMVELIVKPSSRMASSKGDTK